MAQHVFMLPQCPRAPSGVATSTGYSGAWPSDLVPGGHAGEEGKRALGHVRAGGDEGLTGSVRTGPGPCSCQGGDVCPIHCLQPEAH